MATVRSSPASMAKLLRSSSLPSRRSPLRKPLVVLFRRHFCAEPLPPPSLPPEDDPSTVKALQLLNCPEDSWDRGELTSLLFPADESPEDSLTRLRRIARKLQSPDQTIGFLDFVRSSPHNEFARSLVRSTCDRVFGLAACQPGSAEKLYGLYKATREKGIPLTVNSAVHLLRRLGSAGMVDEMTTVFSEIDPATKNTHVHNVYMNGLLKSQKTREVLKVLDGMLEPDSIHAPSDNTGEIVFFAFLRREYAESVTEDEIAELVIKLAKHAVFPNTIQLSKLITRLSKSGKMERACDLLQEVCRLGGPVEAGPCNALLTGFSRVKDIKRMNEVLAKMKEMNVEPNVVTFGIIINSLCKFRRVDDALEVFERMQGKGNESISFQVKPDAIIYNTLIDGLCKVGRQQEALELLEKTRHQDDCSPTAITYNCIIDSYCKSGEIKQARLLFDKMANERLGPNEVTVNILVDGMCKHGRINSGLELLREMQSKGLPVNAKAYTSLICAFCGVNNIAKALELFDEMTDDNSGIVVDVIAYYSVICGLAQVGNMDDASRVVLKLKEAGFSLDVVCYNALINGLCRKNRVAEAHELFKEMKRVGVRRDAVTYNTLIAYFSKIKEFKAVSKLMAQMKSEDLTPTVVTFGTLIHSYCSIGELEEAMKIFEEMGSSFSRIPPNTVTYNILIDAMCEKGEVERAVALMDDMIARKVRPSTNTFNAMFKGLRKENSLEKAFELMDMMTELACKPDYITMEVLTEWLDAVGEVGKLKKFLKGCDVSASTA